MDSQEVIKFNQKVLGKHFDNPTKLLLIFTALLKAVNHYLLHLLHIERRAYVDHLAKDFHLFVREGILDVQKLFIWLRPLQGLLYEHQSSS